MVTSVLAQTVQDSLPKSDYFAQSLLNWELKLESRKTGLQTTNHPNESQNFGLGVPDLGSRR